MKLYCLLTCMTLLFTTGTTPIVSTAASPVSIQQEEGNSTYAIETEWFYRYYNGVLQKRLWSLTDQKWLTDWMDA